MTKKQMPNTNSLVRTAACLVATCTLASHVEAKIACTSSFGNPAVPIVERAACARAVAANPPAADSADGDAMYQALAVIDVASSTRPSPENLDAARRLVNELEKRQSLRPADRRRWHGILLSTGFVEEARADEAAHPGRLGAGLPAVIPLTSPKAPGEARFWRWDAQANILHEQALALGSGTHLIVDASPGCHFCPLAAAAIEKDPTLAIVFRDALWITRPESSFSRVYYQRWNDEHPAERMVVVFDAQGWRLPSDWATPVFRFFRDGEEVVTVKGWTKDSPGALLAAARQLGMMLPSTMRAKP